MEELIASLPISLLFTLICFVLGVLLLCKYESAPKNLPPGPLRVPFIGYSPFMGKKPNLKFMKLKERYGDIFTVYMGRKCVVVLSSYDAMKNALIKKAHIFSARPPSADNLPELNAGGIAFNSGESWIELRRFSLSKLRDLGMGKAWLEPMALDEIHCFMQSLEETNGMPIIINYLIRQSTCNVVCGIIYGYRFDYDDRNFQNVVKTANNFVDSIAINTYAKVLPQFLVKLFGLNNPHDHALNLYKAMVKAIEDHKSGKKQATRDSFMEAWLHKMEDLGGKQTSNFNEKQLARVLWDLFLGGTDTVAVTLTWAILYLIKYPEVQKKIQQEIDDVIGRDRAPSMADQKFMPYAQAVLNEVNRIATIAAFSAFHSTTQDTILNGYFIPKDTDIIPNIWAVHYDPKIFPEPEKFKPERFLNEKGELKRVDELITFGIGKRQCMGESLARTMLFLYFTSLFQRFTFKVPIEMEVNLDFQFSAVIKPYDQEICINLRGM